MDQTIVNLIHDYWRTDDLILKEDETKTIFITSQKDHCDHHYHNLYLNTSSICKFKVQNTGNEAIDIIIIIHNHITIHPKAKWIIEAPSNNTNILIQCHGMVLNRGEILVNHQTMQIVHPLINIALRTNYHHLRNNNNVILNVYNPSYADNVLNYIIDVIDVQTIAKWKITNQFWLILQQLCYAIDVGHFYYYLPKVLKICSILLYHYNENILANVFSVYKNLSAINEKHELFALDLVIYGDQYVNNYNTAQKSLFITGYIRDAFGASIPMQIQSLILRFSSNLFNTQIDVDIFHRLTQLFEFERVGFDALQSISRVVDRNMNANKMAIDYLVKHNVIDILLQNLATKTVQDIVWDAHHQRITEILHILYQILVLSPDKASKYIQYNDRMQIMQCFILKMKSTQTRLQTVSVHDEDEWFGSFPSFSVAAWEKHIRKPSEKTLPTNGVWLHISLQFEFIAFLLIIAKYCHENNDQSQYIHDAIDWFKWFELNINDPSAQNLLQSERVRRKLYDMTKFDHKDIRLCASRIIISFGEESNQEFQLKRKRLLSERFDAIGICLAQCLSNNVTIISKGLRYIHEAMNDKNGDDLHYERLINEGIIQRLCDIVQDSNYDLSLRGQTAITLLSMHQHWSSVMFGNVMQFLLTFLANAECELRIKKNDDGILCTDISIEVIFDGEYIDIIDIDIIKWIELCGEYFDEYAPCELLMVDFMQRISALDMWCLPLIWSAFKTAAFLSKLEKCSASNTVNIKEKAAIVSAQFVNKVNVMGTHDLCRIAMRPCVDLLSGHDSFAQRVALEAISKMITGNPLHVYMALDCYVLDHLIPIIRKHIHAVDDSTDERLLLLSSVRVLLHLSDVKMDAKYLRLLFEALSIATNVNDYVLLEILCKIYARFTQLNGIAINSYVMNHIIETTQCYHKYDVFLINGFLRKYNDQYAPDIIECCLSYARIHGNILQFLIDSMKTYAAASETICNMMNYDENVTQSLLDHNICGQLMHLMRYQAGFALQNTTLIVSKLSESSSHCARFMPQIVALLKMFLLDIDTSLVNILSNILWIIGNIASHDICNRNILLDHNILNCVITMLDNVAAATRPQIYNALIWLMTNICNQGAFDEKYIAPVLKILASCVMICESKENKSCMQMKEDICWICYDLTEQLDVNMLLKCNMLMKQYNSAQNKWLVTGFLRCIDDSHIIPQDVVAETLKFNKIFNVRIERNAIHYMVTLLVQCTSSDVVIVALKVIGNMIASGVEATQYLMDMFRNFLSQLVYLANTKRDETFTNEIFWIFSNICAGSSKQIEHVINENVVELLTSVLQKETINSIDFKTAKHAFWAISNAVRSTRGNECELFLQLIHKNITWSIFLFIVRIDIDSDQDTKLMLAALQTIEMILFGVERQLAIQLIDQCNACLVLKELKLKFITKHNHDKRGNINEMQQIIGNILALCTRKKSL